MTAVNKTLGNCTDQLGQIQESRLNSVMSKRIEKGILELAYVVT